MNHIKKQQLLNIKICSLIIIQCTFVSFYLKVKTPGKHFIKHVLGGSEGTFLITTTGRVLACGSNEHNILGFNSEMSGLRKRKQVILGFIKSIFSHFCVRRYF